MRTPRSAGIAGTGLALVACLALAPGCALGQASPDEADEIAPFRLKSLEGHVLSSYLQDTNDSRQEAYGQPLPVPSSQTISLWRTEVFLMTHSYVYLPGLLSLDLGAGPILDRTTFADDDAGNRSTKALYNLSCKATVLRDKPYRGSVFFEHFNPTQVVGPAQVMFVESRRYGFDASVREPATPVPVALEVTRSRNEGRGSGQTQDDTLDQAKLRATRRIGTLGDAVFGAETFRQDSRSGSTSLPIQATRTSRDSFSLDSRLRRVGQAEHTLDENLSYNSQSVSRSEGEAISENRDAHLSLALASRFSPEWQTQARYAYSDNRMDHQSTAMHALSGGATWHPSAGLSASGTLAGDTIRSTELDADRGALNVSAVWRRPVAAGELSASYAYSLSARDQRAKGGPAIVVGEHVVLAGTAIVPLRAPQVAAGSVVVSNVGRTQVFAEGSDYLLTVVGLATRIQRVVGGGIADGQEVVVDYSYDAGGTFAMTQSDHNAGLQWSYRNLASAYVRYLRLEPRIGSGSPTFELNPVRSTLAGLRLDVPLPFENVDSMVGGFLERESRHEVIAPFERRAWEAYAQVPLPLLERTSLRIGARRNDIDYELSPLLAVRLKAWDLRLWSQPFFGFDFSLDASHDRDTGTPVTRERRYAAGRAGWRVRQFRLDLSFARTRESQGAVESKRSYVRLTARRDF